MIADKQKDKQEIVDIYQDLLTNNIIVESFENKSENNIKTKNTVQHPENQPVILFQP